MSKKNKEKEISEEVFFLNPLIKAEDLQVQTFKNGKIVIWFKEEVIVEGWERESLISEAIKKLNS